MIDAAKGARSLKLSESKYFKTANKMDEALLSMLEKKPFEYITVSEICKSAGVHRSTFYLHYENTVDLLKETTAYLLEKFVSYFPIDTQGIPSRFADCDAQALIFIDAAHLNSYLSYIRENKRVFTTVLSHPTAFNFDAIFQRLFDNIFSPILDRFHYSREDQRYVIKFYLNGVNAIIVEWLKDDCRKSIDEIAAIIRCCILGKTP